MKKIVMVISAALISFQVHAGKDVSDNTVGFVYQPDLAATKFEFAGSTTNNCGSRLYRVRGANEATANRKFSLVLAAFASGEKLAFHDTEVCAGSRSIVS